MRHPSTLSEEKGHPMNESLQEAIDHCLINALDKDLTEHDREQLKAKIELVKELGTE